MGYHTLILSLHIHNKVIGPLHTLILHTYTLIATHTHCNIGYWAGYTCWLYWATHTTAIHIHITHIVGLGYTYYTWPLHGT